MQGGTFTISNGGVFGSLLSMPIINLPQSSILGMHSIIQRPVAIAGKVNTNIYLHRRFNDPRTFEILNLLTGHHLQKNKASYQVSGFRRYNLMFQVEIRPMMYLALSYDHRLIDGREAVMFLRKVKSGVEDPTTILAGM